MPTTHGKKKLELAEDEEMIPLSGRDAAGDEDIVIPLTERAADDGSGAGGDIHCGRRSCLPRFLIENSNVCCTGKLEHRECPACTFWNRPTPTECAMCGTKLMNSSADAVGGGVEKPLNKDNRAEVWIFCRTIYCTSRNLFYLRWIRTVARSVVRGLFICFRFSFWGSGCLFLRCMLFVAWQRMSSMYMLAFFY